MNRTSLFAKSDNTTDREHTQGKEVDTIIKLCGRRINYHLTLRPLIGPLHITTLTIRLKQLSF